MAGRLTPGATIGILGGGQLGRMIALAAADFGLKTVVYEPEISGPAAQVTNQHMAGAYRRRGEAPGFRGPRRCHHLRVRECAGRGRRLSRRAEAGPSGGAPARRGAGSLARKTFFADRGIATAPFARVDTLSDLEMAVEKIGPRSILKTRRFGYDGKGQARDREGVELAGRLACDRRSAGDP